MARQQLVSAVEHLQAGQARVPPPTSLETLHELAALPGLSFSSVKWEPLLLELDETVIEGLI